MTQPIQEPGPSTRTDAKAIWATNQLFRRPGPNSQEIPPYAFMIWDEGTSIAVDTPTNFFGGSPSLESIAPWSLGYDADGSEAPGVDIDEGIRVGPADMDHRTPMHVLIALTVSWAENWDDGDLYCAITMRGGTSADVQGWQTKVYHDKTQGTGGLSFDETNTGVSVVTLTAGAFSNSWVSGSLMHKNGGGSARDLGQVEFSVTKLSDYPYPGGGFVTT